MSGEMRATSENALGALARQTWHLGVLRECHACLHRHPFWTHPFLKTWPCQVQQRALPAIVVPTQPLFAHSGDVLRGLAQHTHNRAKLDTHTCTRTHTLCLAHRTSDHMIQRAHLTHFPMLLAVSAQVPARVHTWLTAAAPLAPPRPAGI